MMSPERSAVTPFEFRAPPPSPIGTSRRSSVTNDEVLTEFLEHSLRVPDLVLPENIFPRQRFIENPPRIDFRMIESSDRDSVLKILDSMASIGFFQLVNHGIPAQLIGAVAAAAAAGVFGISPEKKVAVARSPEKAYGFEEYWHGEDESELCEEFVWSRDEGLKVEMEAISPFGYSSFSKKMEWMTQLTEKVGEKILEILVENSGGKVEKKDVILGHGSVWCVYKQKKQRMNWNDELENCFKHDVIRMLIRGTDFSHAFCFHFCHGSSPLFHVYTKRGWVSFVPDESAIVVTVGNHIQAWSGGQYKHVIGRPIYRDHNKEEESGSSSSNNNNNNGISMAFLFSPTSSSSSNGSEPLNEIRTLSLAHQALFALFLTLLYNFFFYILKYI
ncbi:uncharacterized protein LOC120073645 [Benincasa hispida]|uniref:uncharacterized protein LOC120073645 n=1 Tax=Benincasa hispida TaxID=102211 RepID=UPI0018FF6599|nr:uncharacterized protein LOC120073645 [Benincasa hispida]